MQTFDNQHQVRSISSMLESTPYVQAKNAEIEALRAENKALQARIFRKDELIRQDTVAWQSLSAHKDQLETENADLRTKLDEAQEEVRRLLRPDDEIAQWHPMELGESVECQCDACLGTILVGADSITVTDNRERRQNTTILLPDDVRLCRRKAEGTT